MHLDVTYADITMHLDMQELQVIRDALDKDNTQAALELACAIADELSTALLII